MISMPTSAVIVVIEDPESVTKQNQVLVLNQNLPVKTVMLTFVTGRQMSISGIASKGEGLHLSFKPVRKGVT